MFHDMFCLLLEKRHVCLSGKVAQGRVAHSAKPRMGFSLMGDTAAQLHTPYHPNVQRKCNFKIFLMWT